MRKVLPLLFVAISTIFIGCSSTREPYVPENVVGDWEKYGDTDFHIENISPKAALIDDDKIFVNEEVLKIKLPEGHRLLGFSDDWVISSNIVGELTLQHAYDFARMYTFELKRTIATASVKDDILAVLFANNEMALYSLSQKRIILKEQGEAPLALNSKITPPYFSGDLVLFSTLDGKVVIVNSKAKKKLRTTIVSTQEHFNNIIYFNLVENRVIAATGNKILSLSNREAREDYDIRSAVDDGSDVFIATKQGEIIALSSDLTLKAKAKFPFAHFLGMIVSNGKLYVLERAGYVIEFSKDLSNYSVYDADVEDGYIFVSDKKFYMDDEYISVE